MRLGPFPILAGILASDHEHIIRAASHLDPLLRSSPRLSPLAIHIITLSLTLASASSSTTPTPNPLSSARALGAVLSLSEVGKGKRGACSGLPLHSSKLGTCEGWDSREVVGHAGSQEPAGALEGEWPRLVSTVIREAACSARLMALQACSDIFS